MASSHHNYIGKSSQNSLGLPFGQTHVPHQRLNLFHIDNQEVHLDALNASFFDPHTKSLENGLLHMCSRSLLFDNDLIMKDLIKCRFNNSFNFELLSGKQIQDLFNPGSMSPTPKNLVSQSVSGAFSNLHNSSDNRQMKGVTNRTNERWQTQPSQPVNEQAQASPITIVEGGVTNKTHNQSTNSQRNKISIKKGTKRTKASAQYQTSNLSPQKIQTHRPVTAQQSSLSNSDMLNPRILLDMDPTKKKLMNDFNAHLSSLQSVNANSSLLSYSEQLLEIQVLVVAVSQVIKIPRMPAGPSYIDKTEQTNKFSSVQNNKYFLFVLNDEQARQSEFLYVLTQFAKPEQLQDQNPYISEDDLVKQYTEQISKKYLQMVKFQEKTTNSKFSFKEVVKRITIEGEHTYLMLVRSQNSDFAIEFLPIMNAPHQNSQVFVTLRDIKIASKYRYLYEYKTVRLVTYDSQEFLIQLKTEKQAVKFLEFIQTHASNLDNIILGNPEEATKLWRQGILSNGEYLLFINFVSNRSFNDLTQYPAFPWVIADFKSETLDLHKEQTYRDLSKPIGALSVDKLDQFKSKYYEIINKSSTLVHTNQMSGLTGSDSNDKPYMFLSHYSTPGIVLYYLIRRFPSYLLKVQNEAYGGPPDRIFYDINMSWYNCMKVLADNKELTPEFYFGDGSFLRNLNNVELGLNHLEEKVNDVTLPQWSSSHQDFILKNRQALESNYVSANLHKWIDLVFGHLQRGEKASFANNLFQPMTLEENVDYSQISSPLEKQAIEAQIRHFGQCPLQVFKDSAHPQRLARTILITDSQQISQEVQDSAYTAELNLEIQRLHASIDEMTKKNEESLLHQIQEFQQLDEIRKKKITRYKEEGEQQIEKYRQLVEILKNKQLNLRGELEIKFKEKETAYIEEIESLRQQLHAQQQQQLTNRGLMSAIVEKHPGYKEYQKTLEPISSKDNKAQRIVKKVDQQLSNNSIQSRINGGSGFMTAQSSQQIISQSKLQRIRTSNHHFCIMSQQSQQKKKSKHCSCFELLKWAFTRQNSQQMGSSKTDPLTSNLGNQLNHVQKLIAVSEGASSNTNLTSDLTNATFLKRQLNQQQCDNSMFIKQGTQNIPNNLVRNPLNFPNLEESKEMKQQEQEYIFRFQQRHEYLNKKFAPKPDIRLGGETCKIVGNFAMQTLIREEQVKYCEGIGQNYFLLKYFKYECGMCFKLSSHILVANCCTGPICYHCSIELAEHYADNGPVKKCIFCNLKVDVRYLIRDTTQSEQRILHQKCKETLKMLEQKKEGKRNLRKSQRKSNAKDQPMLICEQSSHYKIDIPLEASAIKPKKLTFVEDCTMKTAASNYLLPEFEVDNSSGKKQQNFLDEVFSSNEDQNLYTLRQQFQSTADQFTSLQPLDEIQTVRTSDIMLESKPKQTRNLAGRKRIGNRKSHVDKENLNSNLFEEEQPMSKRLRQRNKSDVSLNASQSSSVATTIQRQSKKIRK